MAQNGILIFCREELDVLFITTKLVLISEAAVKLLPEEKTVGKQIPN